MPRLSTLKPEGEKLEYELNHIPVLFILRVVYF